jgi:hypothetical protein
MYGLLQSIDIDINASMCLIFYNGVIRYLLQFNQIDTFKSRVCNLQGVVLCKFTVKNVYKAVLAYEKDSHEML